jgi:UDP-N-acetylmuramoyl-L-alanyl-D-glutamate--2,6-diaminopimelate ligase
MNPKRIARKVVPKKGVKALEVSYRWGRGAAWRARYGFPGRKLKIIAVTGTNGKTTTVSYINSVLKAAGLKTAVYTTVYFEVDGKREPNRSHMTVQSQKSAQAFFAKAKKANVDWVVLELTSMALDQKRIAGFKVEVAVMTNLTQEHLDYHKTMENYAAAKARLFGYEYDAKFCVLNADDEWFDFFIERSIGKPITYGVRPSATIRLLDSKLTDHGSTFTVEDEDDTKQKLSTKLIGEFNIYNALAAYGVGRALKLDTAAIDKGIGELDTVEGRMERIDAGQAFDVYVDFAITPDAIQMVLVSLREITKGRILIVFGATGDRDKDKRPAMGEVAAKLADRVFLTDDETYREDSETIRQAVYKGIQKANGTKKTTVIADRREAIKAAFAEAKRGDVVLLTGIGHEDYRNMGGVKEPWDERQVARELLKNKS